MTTHTEDLPTVQDDAIASLKEDAKVLAVEVPPERLREIIGDRAADPEKRRLAHEVANLRTCLSLLLAAGVAACSGTYVAPPDDAGADIQVIDTGATCVTDAGSYACDDSGFWWGTDAGNWPCGDRPCASGALCYVSGNVPAHTGVCQ